MAGLSLLGSAALFERLTLAAYGPGARWGAAWFAAAAAGDLWIGRLAFALGVCLALAATLLFARGRPAWSALLGALCAAASPVAGVLLALAGLTHALARRSARPLLALAAAPAALLLAMGALFPEGGSEPFPLLSLVATLVVVASFLWALPPGQPLLRVGAAVYLLACAVSLLFATPMGSNIERYAVLLAAPLLLCARAAAHPPMTGARSAAGGARALGALLRGGGPLALATALGICALWVAWGPVRETAAVAGNESTHAAYYAPLKRFLAQRGGPLRVEVPLTRSHWEAALLAPSISLARGWEKQLDERYDHVLLAPGLTAGAYERWLREQAVSYVALPDAPLDPSSAQEGRLIRAGLPYLREVLSSPHWRIYALAFGLGCFMAGLGGAIVVPSQAAVLGMGVEVLVIAFVVVVIGGLGSLEGALVGALIVSALRTITIQFWEEFELAALYLIAAIVLLIRPTGLFGRRA